MRTIKQSTAYDLMVWMADSADHITGKTSLTLTITASKAGAAFSSISPTVTERGNGWYALALTTSHTDTIGDLALHVTGSGADNTDVVVQVRANVLGDTLPANITQLSGNTSSATYLSSSAGMIIPGTVDNTAFTTTTTEFEANDITTAASLHYVGRAIIFTSGTLFGQACSITNYVLNGGRGHFTVSALTSAPENSVTFIIV